MTSTIYKEVKSAILDLKNKPTNTSSLETQLLFGEKVKVKIIKNNWSYICSIKDNYHGWIKNQNIGNVTKKNYKIKNVFAFVFKEPNFKSKVIFKLFLNSSLKLIDFEKNWAKILVNNEIGFVHKKTLSNKNKNFKNWIDTCIKFRNVPYLWGGKTLKHRLLRTCPTISAILQYKFSRNTIQQINFESYQIKSTNKISRGCLLFWDGHVGISLNKHELIHSNLYHLGVEIENIDACVKRIGKIKEIKKLLFKITLRFYNFKSFSKFTTILTSSKFC